MQIYDIFWVKSLLGLLLNSSIRAIGSDLVFRFLTQDTGVQLHRSGKLVAEEAVLSYTLTYIMEKSKLSKVAIIGGGPAGSSFALFLLRYAQQKGVYPEVTIYQQRDFDKLGAKGCKGCAGILSALLLKNLNELDVNIPEFIVQSKIEHYAVHTPYTSISINNPEQGTAIASVYRGGGPRISKYENSVSFDGWLLKQAQRQGANVEYQTVSGIYLDQEPKVEVKDSKIAYDLVVLASGVNTKLIPIHGLKYVPPKTLIMAQDELYLGSEQVQSLMDNIAHVFLIPRSGFIFGTLVPKGPFVNVSVLCKGRKAVSVADFLSYDIVRRMLPEHYERVCGCRPRIAVGSARNYYADRFVAVGDAVVSRLYKDGIGSALVTAREAARTVVQHGLSRHDFDLHYQPFCEKIHRDNRWGMRLFWINDRFKNSASFFLAQHQLVGEEQKNITSPQTYTKVIWGMFTGSYSYRDITDMALNPSSLAKFFKAFSTESLNRLSHGGEVHQKLVTAGRRKVLILGSGFGGTYTLRNIVGSLKRNDNVEVTMVSDENFFLFAPLLHTVAMGGIETRHIAYPIRRLNFSEKFNFIQAVVEKIDLHDHKVITSHGTLDFDYLALALGGVTDTSGLNSQESNIFPLKTLHESILIRNHIIGVFEQASMVKEPERLRQLLTFVVCGGGYTGVQIVTELREFVFRNLPRYYRTIEPHRIRVILVEAEPKIVADLHTKLSDYAMEQIQRMGIEVRLRSRVTGVWENHVEINGKEVIPTSTIIWAAGVKANPRIAELDVAKDDIGRVLVNEYLEVPEFAGVYAVGDCAHFVDPKSGRPVPPRAHIAVRQGRIAASNILAEVRGTDKQPYRYSLGAEMLSLGASKAILRFHGLRLYGFPARLIWIIAYTSLTIGDYNRARIMTDWLLGLVFGRDITLLKLKR